MPIYEYKCEKCGLFEVMQKVKDPVLTVCPNEGCGCKVEKVMSPCVSHFKGSGFYQTDYKGSSPSNSGGGKKAPKSDKSN